MTHILQMYPGRLSAMAANLFYLTVIGDPLSPEAVNMAKIMTTVKARSAQHLPSQQWVACYVTHEACHDGIDWIIQ
jgi:hypothetical protein